MNVPAGPGGGQQGKRCRCSWVGRVPGWHWATDGHVACVLVDLASVLTPEIMAPILANADVQERLLPYLPSGESLPQTADEIQNTLTSPQFQQVCMPVALSVHVILTWWAWCLRRPALHVYSVLQALGMFSAALASGQLGPLMCQFGLPAEAVEAANKGGKCRSPVSARAGPWLCGTPGAVCLG